MPEDGDVRWIDGVWKTYERPPGRWVADSVAARPPLGDVPWLDQDGVLDVPPGDVD